MMPTNRFERQLPVLLDELAQARTPDYFDDLLQLTARTRQRPAWTLLERWLPMVDIARQPLLTSRIPLRTIGVALLLVALLLAAVAAFIVGTRRDLPAPFGLAQNGLVAFAKGGDIYTADLVTGAPRAVVTGPEIDLRPLWSLDGTRFAFERKVSGASGPGQVYVADAGGTGLTLLTKDPLSSVASYGFSPDGTEVLISARLGTAWTMLIAKSDGTAIRPLEVGALTPKYPAYRPPSGAEIVFVGQRHGETASGLFAIKPDGTGLRPIVEPSDLIVEPPNYGGPKWSPDGTKIAFSAVRVEDEVKPGGWLRVYVVGADGQPPRLLRDLVPPDDMEFVVAWSNDGTRLLISGCYRSEAGVADCPSTMEVVPVGGTGPIVRIDVAGGFPGADGTQHTWAPDDLSIISTPLSVEGTPMGDAVAWDALTGRSKPVPWTGAGATSWQRLAP